MLTASVIGCGHGGGLSLDALSNSSDYALIAAADPSVDARGRVADRFPDARLFADYRDMLTECRTDVVCVATPAPSHAAIAREVLHCKPKGLLLEKPLACDVLSAEALLREVRDAACPVVVPHGMLVLPAAQEIKVRMRRGDIGEISSVEVQNAVDLLNAGIHWLAYLCDVFDNEKPRIVNAEFDVSGHVVNDGVQVESRGVTRIEFDAGVCIELNSGNKTEPTSDVLPREEQRGALFRVTGSEGAIEFSAWAGSYWIQAGKSDGEFIKQPLPAGLSYHQVFLEQLAQNIATGKPDLRSAELSLAALRLIESAYQQHGNSEWALGVPAQRL
jgi:predicted dehydrogenase